MDPRLILAPERRLIMTHALRQSLEVLQMPQAELSEWLLEEIEKNPLLEQSGSPFQSLPIEIEAVPSLYDHLQSQIRETFKTREEKEVAETLLHRLDDKGYLELPLPEGSEKILPILQSFDPPGIFATNLQECLLLQLKGQNLIQTDVYRLVSEFFADLLEGRYALIEKELDLKRAIQKLAQLSFRPASSFRNEIAPSIFPDLAIRSLGGKWKIEIPDRSLPQFALVSYELQNLNKEEKHCVREWMTRAKWVSYCLKRRHQMLLKIGAYLVQKKGVVSIRKGAADLQIHESTLSRAISGKYVETEEGLMELRSFFQKSLSAKELIQRLCAQEKSLTDLELASRLAEQGINVARRTVAKYRKSLKIGSARSRPYSVRKGAPK